MALTFDNFKKFVLNDIENNKDLYDICEEFQFSSSNLKKVHKIVKKFTKVKIFNLSRNSLTTLPKEVFNISTLISLNLSDNNFEFLSNDICHLNNLQSLILISNNLKSLPDSIGNLQKLEKLWVSKNELTKLPKSLYTIKSLQDLRTSHNKLTYLEDFSDLTNLKMLYLDHNAVEIIPDGLSKLIELQKLDISYNKTKNEKYGSDNEKKIENVYELDSIEYFKNDFNSENKLCSVCKKETNTITPCDHYVCAICINKKLMENFNDEYETECPTCKKKIKTTDLKEDNDKYQINKIMCCQTIGTQIQNCLCGKC